jgi:hypothetical protein
MVLTSTTKPFNWKNRMGVVVDPQTIVAFVNAHPAATLSLALTRYGYDFTDVSIRAWFDTNTK